MTSPEQRLRASVLLLNKAYPPWPGGIENHTRQLAEGLARRGWKVDVLCSSFHSFSIEERQRNLQIHRTPNWGTVWSQPLSPRILTEVRRFNSEIVHVQVPFPLGIPACLRVPKTRPLVVTWQSDIVRQRAARPLLAPLERMLLRRADAIIATSPRLIEHSKVLPAFREKCRAIPLGIDPRPFTFPTQETLDLAEKLGEGFHHPLVAFVGRLVGYKGVDILIKSMRQLEKIHCVIVGEGPKKEDLKRLSEREGLGRRVRFAGHVPDEELPAYLHAAELFVLPSVSRNEAFGICQLEAMAAGLPVISTDLESGVPWVNQHEQTGLVVPPGDADALAGAIRTLADDQDRAKALGEQGRQRVLELFTAERMIGLHEELYGELLDLKS